MSQHLAVDGNHALTRSHCESHPRRHRIGACEGLSSALEEAFGPLLVESMMGGHACARPVRGHELASMSLHRLIVS
jgi:hypothetical protein